MGILNSLELAYWNTWVHVYLATSLDFYCGRKYRKLSGGKYENEWDY